jgi:hypothetical protein
MTADNLVDAADKISSTEENGGGSNNKCILVMVRRSYGCCCCDIKFDIPANFVVLEEICGKSNGVMPSGA